MAIAREEIFGPVLTVIPMPTRTTPIRIANDSEFGLAGSVWTRDVAHGLDISGQIRTGTFGINMYMLDISSPFGGSSSPASAASSARKGWPNTPNCKPLSAQESYRISRKDTMTQHTLDNVTASVIRSSMETICFEMATYVSRTATTPILNQSNERNATILDATGKLAALSVGIPQFMLSSTLPVRFAAEFFAGELYPAT